MRKKPTLLRSPVPALGVLSFLLLCSPAYAEEPAEPVPARVPSSAPLPDEPPPPLSPSEVLPIPADRLSEQERTAAREALAALGDPEWTRREAATASLRGMGLRALGTLLDGAVAADEEVRSRCEALIQELVECATVEKRGYLGITWTKADPLPKGCGFAVHVNDVISGTPAECNGLRRGDVIVKIRGRFMGSKEEFLRSVQRTPPGAPLPIEVERTASYGTVRILFEPRLMRYPNDDEEERVTRRENWRLWCQTVGGPELRARLTLAEKDGESSP